jgi:hypothetical protein
LSQSWRISEKLASIRNSKVSGRLKFDLPEFQQSDSTHWFRDARTVPRAVGRVLECVQEFVQDRLQGRSGEAIFFYTF